MNFFLREIFLSFQQKKNEVLSINIEKVSILPLFCKVHYLWCQISEKIILRKNFEFFFFKNTIVSENKSSF